jgi:hypothetical protein
MESAEKQHVERRLAAILIADIADTRALWARTRKGRSRASGNIGGN